MKKAPILDPIRKKIIMYCKGLYKGLTSIVLFGGGKGQVKRLVNHGKGKVK